VGVYTDFAALMAVRASLGYDNLIPIVFAAGVTLPASSDAAGWDFRNTPWVGPGSSRVTVVTAAGFKCQESKAPPSITGLTLTHGGTAAFHEQVTASTCFLVLDDAWVQRSGTGVFWKQSHAGSVSYVTQKNGSYYPRYGVGKTVFDIATSGATITHQSFDTADAQSLTIATAVGTTWNQVNYSSLAGLSITAAIQTGMLGTVSVTNAAGGGGEEIVTGFVRPEVVPTSPSALDDNFGDGALDPKWLTFDPAGILTATEENGSLKLVTTTTGGLSIAGKYQPFTADDEHEFLVELGVEGPQANYLWAGMGIMSPNGTPTTTDIQTFSIVDGVDANMPFPADEFYDAYNNRAGGPTNKGVTLTHGQRIFVLGQVKVSTKAFRWWMSGTNGFSWIRVSSATMTLVPTSVLLFTQGFGIQTARFRFFRYRSAANGILDVTPGPTGRAGV
jgi:hypothetical protein